MGQPADVRSQWQRVVNLHQLSLGSSGVLGSRGEMKFWDCEREQQARLQAGGEWEVGPGPGNSAIS